MDELIGKTKKAEAFEKTKKVELLGKAKKDELLGKTEKDELIEKTEKDELFEKMKKLIAEKLEVDEEKITLEASFRQDLGADSLDTYELVYAIEEEMGISIPDEKANEFETVKDAYEYIKSQQK